MFVQHVSVELRKLKAGSLELETYLMGAFQCPVQFMAFSGKMLSDSKLGC